MDDDLGILGHQSDGTSEYEKKEGANRTDGRGHDAGMRRQGEGHYSGIRRQGPVASAIAQHGGWEVGLQVVKWGVLENRVGRG